MVATEPINELLEESDLLEWATLWSASNAVADAFGNKRVSKACNIPARWRFKTVRSADPHSGSLQVMGKVNVAQDIALDSILFKGKQEDYKPSDQLYKVVGFNSSNDINNENSRRSVDIALWNEALPIAV